MSARSVNLQASQADSDEQLVTLWLHGKSAHSRRAYAADVQRLLAAVQKPLSEITLGDRQAFADRLSALSANSRKRILSSVKRLFPFNAAVAHASCCWGSRCEGGQQLDNGATMNVFPHRLIG